MATTSTAPKTNRTAGNEFDEAVEQTDTPISVFLALLEEVIAEEVIRNEFFFFFWKMTVLQVEIIESNCVEATGERTN